MLSTRFNENMLVLISKYLLHARNTTKEIEAAIKVKYRMLLNSKPDIYIK